MMNDIMEKVYSVYGNDLPKDRDLYQAKRISPVSMLEIKKAFGSYERFKQEYLALAMKKREASKKELKKDVKKSTVKK